MLNSSQAASEPIEGADPRHINRHAWSKAFAQHARLLPDEIAGVGWLLLTHANLGGFGAMPATVADRASNTYVDATSQAPELRVLAGLGLITIYPDAEEQVRLVYFQLTLADRTAGQVAEFAAGWAAHQASRPTLRLIKGGQ